MKDLKSIESFIEDVEDYVHESKNYQRGFKLIVERKDFGKRPLELGMFIPCDKYGNVLKKPSRKGAGGGMLNLEMQYQEAKERVIFEGCKIVDGNCIKINESTYLVKDVLRLYKTIEDLTELGLTLTKEIETI